MRSDSKPIAATLVEALPATDATRSARRFQFTLARLLRCVFFASLTCGLEMAAFSRHDTNGVVALLGILGVPASFGAAIGTLAGRTMRGALIGLGLWVAGPVVFFVPFWMWGCFEAENDVLRWCLIAGNTIALAAAALLFWRPRWAGWLFMTSGLVIGACAASAWAKPRLVNSNWNQYPGPGRGVAMLIIVGVWLSLVMLVAAGVTLWLSRRSRSAQRAMQPAASARHNSSEANQG